MAKDWLNLPWMPWMPPAFRSDPAVIAMEREEQWRYRDALDSSWMSSDPGVATEDQWRRWCGYTVGQWPKHRERISEAFRIDGDLWIQRRQRDDWLHATEKSRKAKASAAVRWQSVRNADALPSHSDRNAEREREKERENPTPSAPAGASESVSQPDEKAETHEDRSGSTNGTPDGSNLTLTPPGPQANGRRSGAKAGEPPAKWKAGFEGEFWPAYLRHRSEGKAAALAVWMRIEPKTQATFDAIMDGLDAQSAKWRDDQTEPRFKPHARTWLFQRRWTDFESVNGKEPVA